MKLTLKFKIDIRFSMCRASIFSSDIAMISNLNILINIIIITDLTFITVLKIFMVFFTHHKFFVNFFFITSLQYLFSSIILLIKLQDLLRGSVHTQTAVLNVKLTFVGVWVKMPDVRVVAEMSKTNFQNTMCNNSNTK